MVLVFFATTFLGDAFLGAVFFAAVFLEAAFFGAATADFFLNAAFLWGVPSLEFIITKQSDKLSSFASLLPLGIL
jgi:hypothetical protein